MFEREIFTWFERFENLPKLLKDITEMPNADIVLGLTLGFPRQLAGFLALEVGEWSLAKKLLQQELDTSFLPPGLMKSMQSDRKFIDGITAAPVTVVLFPQASKRCVPSVVPVAVETATTLPNPS